MIFNLEQYAGKSILILGGGTSTLDVNWEALDYDYVWTCNEFYLEPRVVSQDIDLYLLSFTTDLQHPDLLNKLKRSNTTVIYEPTYFRGKQLTKEFKAFQQEVEIPVYEMNLYQTSKEESAAAFSGAMFRLICTALHTEASNIYFAGFDGFDEKFTNIHAFTKHPGLKDSDTRRTFKGTRESYHTVFTEAFTHFLRFPNHKTLQNLGEGLSYNIGTPISKKHFKLKEEVYEAIR